MCIVVNEIKLLIQRSIIKKIPKIKEHEKTPCAVHWAVPVGTRETGGGTDNKINTVLNASCKLIKLYS